MITNQISGLSIKAKCRKQCNETSLYIYIIFMKQLFNMKGIVSVLHQNEGGIGKSIPEAQEIS